MHSLPHKHWDSLVGRAALLIKQSRLSWPTPPPKAVMPAWNAVLLSRPAPSSVSVLLPWLPQDWPLPPLSRRRQSHDTFTRLLGRKKKESNCQPTCANSPEILRGFWGICQDVAPLGLPYPIVQSSVWRVWRNKNHQMHTNACVYTHTLTYREICLHLLLHNLWKSKNQNGAQGVSLLMNTSSAC